MLNADTDTRTQEEVRRVLLVYSDEPVPLRFAGSGTGSGTRLRFHVLITRANSLYIPDTLLA